jgi:hypothetical protein
MNLYFQLGLIIVITWYLFYYKEKSIIEKYRGVGRYGRTVFSSGAGFNGGGRGGGIASLATANYYSQYRQNSYDLNDLSQSRPKYYYDMEFDNDLDQKKIKYFKAVDDSLDRIRLLANKNQETIYNTQDRNPTPIESNPKPFEFIAKYLENKMNDMGRNLYKVTFNKFKNIQGEEIDEQYKVFLDMEFSIKIRKESYSDKKSDYTFVAVSEAVINKANPRYNTKGNVFFRTLFVDNKDVNEYRPVSK